MQEKHEKVVLIGAGSASFTRGLLADMIRAKWSGELALVDIDEQAIRVAEGLARKMVEAGGSSLKVTATKDRKQALPGATVVICTINVGGRRAWEQDVLVPRKYGIYQPVGDTVMPGGSSRALRMVPAMVAIARDVVKLAPGAVFINYANPMSVICRAIRKDTGANVIGLCHGVPDIARFLAGILKVGPRDLEYAAVGINHLSWFTELKCKGENLVPRLLSIAKEKVAMVDSLKPENFGVIGWIEGKNTPQEEPFTWQLTNLLGAYPAPGDRHVTEFFGRMFAGKGSYYGKTLGVDAYTFEGVVKAGDAGYARMAQMAMSNDRLSPEMLGLGGGEHEQAVEIIESIHGDHRRIYSANLPNRGQVPNLPADSVIECPAVATADGMQPVKLAPVSSGIAGTLGTRWQWVETIVEAALEGSRTKFVQALLLDGAVPSIQVAEQLADDLLAAQKHHLPQFK